MLAECRQQGPSASPSQAALQGSSIVAINHTRGLCLSLSTAIYLPQHLYPIYLSDFIYAEVAFLLPPPTLERMWNDSVAWQGVGQEAGGWQFTAGTAGQN